MLRYDRRILNALLDSYENSFLATGENKRKIRVAYLFTKKNMPEYFDESSVAYEEIHSSIQQLEQKGYLEIKWKKGGHIVQKVLLNEAARDDIYRYVGRVAKARQQERTLEALRQMRIEYQTRVTDQFIDYLEARIVRGQSVKEYIDLGNVPKTSQLIKALACIETNRTDCYLREFSIMHFGDIDAGGFEILEDLKRKTGMPFRRYHMDLETLKTYEHYTKPLTDRDKKRLRRLYDQQINDYRQVILYMLEKEIKLEQECIVLKGETNE